MAFVISAGQLAATDRPAAQAPYALSFPDGTAQDYATIWKTQHQVRTVVSFIARNVAQLGLHHYRRVSDTDRQRVTDSPMARLLGRPNPFTTPYRLMDALVHDVGIYDTAYLAKVRADDGYPGALVRLDPRQTTPVGENPFMPDGFELRGSKGKRVIPADQVVYFRGYNPTNARGGCSPIEALRRTLLEEWNANTFREQLWRNGARMSGYISRPVEAPSWSKEARGRFKREWRDQYLDDGVDAGGTPILEDGMAFSAASVTPEQAQYLEARKLTREEVAAAYHVPLPMVGILDHATFSNIKEQHKQLYTDCLGPTLEMIVEELELQLLGEFPDTDSTYLEFNLAAKLQGSFEEEAAAFSTSVGAPWMTRNEARARKNLPEVDGGDELVTPLNVMIGGQASPADSVPDDRPVGESSRLVRDVLRGGGSRQLVKAAARDEQVDRARDVLSAYFERQGKALATAVGAGKSARRRGRKADDVNDLFDDDRWNTELAADLYRLNILFASAAAVATLEALGEDPDEYDEDMTLAWLAANAERVAGAVNGATKRRLIDILAGEPDDPSGAVTELFATYASARAAQLARSHATSLAGFGTTEAVRQTGRESTKTWRVRSTNPRPSHARLNGETVGLNEKFSNGADWPGDSDLDEDERAGCTCAVDIEFAD